MIDWIRTHVFNEAESLAERGTESNLEPGSVTPWL